MLRFIRWMFAVWSRRATRRLPKARSWLTHCIHDWDSLALQRLRTLEHGIRIIRLSSPILIPDNMAVVVAEEAVVTVEEAAAAEATAQLGARPPEEPVVLEAMAPE